MNPTCTVSSTQTCTITGVTNAQTAAVVTMWDDTSGTVWTFGRATAPTSTTILCDFGTALASGHCAANSNTGVAGASGAAGPTGATGPTGTTQHTITIPISGTPIVTGQGSISTVPSNPVQYSCTINHATAIANASGSLTVDIWKANAAVPTSGNKISASAPVALASQQINTNSALTAWTTSVVTNDVFWGTVATADGVLNAATVQLTCQ